MDMSGRLGRSKKLAAWIDEHVVSIKWPSDDRSVMAAGCLDVSLEHHRAVVLLVENKYIGSAFSLVRSVFESYARAIWLHRCASDAELASFQLEKLNKTFGAIISDIEMVDGFDVGVLSDVKKHWWSPMNSFQHCGFAQVVRRITDSEIRPNYAEAEVLEALRFVDTIAILAVGYFAGVVGDQELKQAVLDKLDEDC